MSELTQENLELLRNVIGYADRTGYDYDIRVEITEEHEDYVKIRTINDEGETELTASVRVLGDYSYEDAFEPYEDEPRTFDNVLLGIWVDGERDDHRWRIVDARGSSLFAILYCCN